MKITILFVVCGLLSACATYHAQPIDPTVLIQSFEARTLHDSGLRRYVTAHLDSDADAWSLDAWDFTTLTLAAFYFSPELDIARTKRGTSQAAILTAAQRPNPLLQFPLKYTVNPRDGVSPYTFGLGLNIPMETAGKRGYRIAQAQQFSNAARFNIGNIAWQVRSRLRGQMLNLYAAIHRASILEQQINAQQQIVDMLDKRLSVGAASAPETYQARITLTQNRLDLEKVQRQIVEARTQMASTIGLPISAITNANIRFDAFERIYSDIPPDAVRRHAILNRADLLAALAEYEARQAALQLEIAKQYPDIYVGPGYTFDAGERGFVLPVSGIALPIFNQNQGPIAEAVARRKEVAARVNALQAQAINDTERAVQAYRAALKNLHLSKSLLSFDKRHLQALQTSFRTGATNRLTLTLAQRDTYVNTLAHLDVLVRVQESIGQLEDAMQRPLSATDLHAIPA
ncbi:MAG: Outer membrane protein TolC [Candidatus Nitrotoga sp. LAW]|nr:MAG: Outer membrane protein TolC [Candidatus Nitrotoga sp. LAW]